MEKTKNNFLIICRYLNIVKNQRTSLLQIDKFTNCNNIKILNKLWGKMCYFDQTLNERWPFACLKGNNCFKTYNFLIKVENVQMVYSILGSEWASVVSASSWREQTKFQWYDDEVRFVLDQHAELDVIVLTHWNNSPRTDLSPHSGTLSWFRAIQSLPFLLNAACLAERKQITIL